MNRHGSANITKTRHAHAKCVKTCVLTTNLIGEMMTTEPTLFDALQAADEAIARVDRNANPDWKEEAARAIWKRSKSGETFTTDEIMEDLAAVGVETHDARALGPVMRRAIRKKIVTEVGMTRSRRRHGARIPVYSGVSDLAEMRK